MIMKLLILKASYHPLFYDILLPNITFSLFKVPPKEDLRPSCWNKDGFIDRAMFRIFCRHFDCTCKNNHTVYEKFWRNTVSGILEIRATSMYRLITDMMLLPNHAIGAGGRWNGRTANR